MTGTNNMAAPEGAQQEVCVRLQNLWRKHRWLYVMVDRYDDPVLTDEVNAVAADERPIWWPLKDALFKDTPERSPALLALDYRRAAHGGLLERSVALSMEQVQRGDSRSLCAWLFSARDPKALVEILSSRLDVLYPDLRRIYLRYFDPRVMPRLMQIVGDRAAPAQLMAPIHTWCQYGRDGEWLSFNASPALAASVVRPNAQQAQAIDRIALINQMARTLAGQGTHVPHEGDADIDSLLVDARALGLIEDEDLVACAVHAWKYGPQTLADPVLLQHIERARDTGLPLAAIIDAATTCAPPA
jgi:hypothetical protein